MAATADESEAAEKPAGKVRGAWRRFARTLSEAMPKGLFARSLIIIIAPVVLLQSLVVFGFMERNWQDTTQRLSEATVGEIAALVDLIEATPPGDSERAAFNAIIHIAATRFGLNVAVLPPEALPPPGPKPFFSPLDRVMSHEITREIGKPFWIDTVGRSNLVEIRIQLSRKVLRIFAPRSQSFAANALIFITAMVATSMVLLAIAIIFLRNQIKPILTLTAAVDDFGKGRAVGDFAPRGAREVRQATVAFHQMRERVERQIDQRTAMLSGVSHDLRTILTRLRLQLVLLKGPEEDLAALRADVDDMGRMLEGYLAFARGDSGETAVETDIAAMLDSIAEGARISGTEAIASFSGEPLVKVRPQSFKRCVDNLVSNAGRHADHVVVVGTHADGELTIVVDDDGPGIPFEEQEAVFKPFYRLDDARNLNETGTGLGLPIARDIARSHGGDIGLGDSPMGGLRVTVTIPA